MPGRGGREVATVSLMWPMLRKLYARRIVNVNVNVIVAGVLALMPVLLIVKGYHRLGLPNAWLPAVTFVADVVCDVAIYYGLHWLSNHAPIMRRERLETLAYAATVDHVPFFKDATIVQVQRMVLSPVLYGLWLGAQWVLVHDFGWHPVTATAVGFALGVGIARTMHTIWMLWEMRAGGPGRIVRADPAVTRREHAEAAAKQPEQAGV